MDLESLIRGTIFLSLTLISFALGLRSTIGDATYLLRQPGLLARSLLAMYIVFPALVIGLVMVLNLTPTVKIALVALALSPVPPFLPGKQLKLVEHETYIYGLLVVASLLAIAFVPAAMALIDAHLGIEKRVTAAQILRIVALTMLLPLAAGMIVRRLWGTFALRAYPTVNSVGGVLLIIAVIPVLVLMWPAIFLLIGNGTLLAIIVFTLIGLAVGHWLGGPNADDRTVLALATASRHPAVAIAIASAGFPDHTLVPAAILLALIVNALAAAPYVAWRKRLHSGHSNTQRLTTRAD